MKMRVTLFIALQLVGAFTAAASAESDGEDPFLSATLAALDGDESGTVDASEISHFVSAMATASSGIISLTSKEGRLALALAILKEYDADGSGTIDASEVAASKVGGDKTMLATFLEEYGDSATQHDNLRSEVDATKWMIVAAATACAILAATLVYTRASDSEAARQAERDQGELRSQAARQLAGAERQAKSDKEDLRIQAGHQLAEVARHAENATAELRSEVDAAKRDATERESKLAEALENLRQLRREKSAGNSAAGPDHSSSEEAEEGLHHLQNFQMKKTLGKGAFGTAYLCKSLAGKEYVLKKMEVSRMQSEQIISTVMEAETLTSLRHPNIVRCYASFHDRAQGFFCIVMEYADGGDLGKKLAVAKATSSPFDEPEILGLFFQIALAIKHVHDRDIIHRDLKPDNIFLMQNGQVKLGDFGVARRLSNPLARATTCAGTPVYMAPEVLDRSEPYNHKADVFSLGIIVHEMCALELPFGSPAAIQHGDAPLLPPGRISADLAGLITEMLTKDQSRRPSIDDVLKSLVSMMPTDDLQVPPPRPTTPAAFADDSAPRLDDFLRGGALLKVGDKVRVKRDVSEPKYGWGGVSILDVGFIVEVGDGIYRVKFAGRSSLWTGAAAEMELAGSSDNGADLAQHLMERIRLMMEGVME